ncbi:MAG: SxtJ family membrane protein [Deltaproteobacteria bacterium]|nr:SxtJ family membrane protein [Deltaproteobacteria bacterium]
MNPQETSKTISALILALLLAYLFFDAQWLLWAAVLLAVGNVFENRPTAALAKYWLHFGALLGRINSRIILTIMFFVILTPIAGLYRLFNREKVDHFRTNRRGSYFDDVQKKYAPEDFEKPW